MIFFFATQRWARGLSVLAGNPKLPSASLCLLLSPGLRYCDGFERCHELWSVCRDQKVTCGEGDSVSLGPDPQASISLSATADRTAGGGRGRGGGATHTYIDTHTLSRPLMQVTAGGAGAVWSVPVWQLVFAVWWAACVSWIPPGPLVELYHWPQGEGTGGLVTARSPFRERASWTRGVLLLSLRSSFHIVDVRSAPSGGKQRERKVTSWFTMNWSHWGRAAEPKVLMEMKLIHWFVSCHFEACNLTFCTAPSCLEEQGVEPDSCQSHGIYALDTSGALWSIWL